METTFGKTAASTKDITGLTKSMERVPTLTLTEANTEETGRKACNMVSALSSMQILTTNAKVNGPLVSSKNGWLMSLVKKYKKVVIHKKALT